MIDRARVLWRDLSGTPDAFTRPLVVVGCDEHRCSPPGWVGAVAIRGDVVVACPSDQLDRVREAVDTADPHRLALDLRYLGELVEPDQCLGPALLFYDDEQRSPQADVIGPLPAHDDRVVSVLEDATDAERDESGLADGPLSLFVASDQTGRPSAICGWHLWPCETAHIGVLAGRSSRGSGSAKKVARQTLLAAADAGLLAQWRAATTNESSIRLARSLGLSEVGSQFSVKLRS